MSKPKIRLKGFAEDWEQRKLGDLVDRVTRKNQDLVSELPLTISAQYGLIDQNEFFDKRVASKDVSGYYLIEKGEFAYNKSTSTDAPWGAIKRLDRYENGVLSTLYIVFGIKEDNPVDSDFLVSYYSTNLWHKGIHEIAAEGARNHGLLNIAPVDFFETKLMIPQDIGEQQKIGKYFEELERLITLHQRKCDEAKKLKKYMLQKMFPKNKTSVPEIRFESFTEDWEQRKFSEGVSEIGDGLHGTPIYCEDGNVYFINGNNLVDGKIVISAETKKVNESQQSTADKSLDETTILMSINGTIGNLAYYSGERLMLGKSAAYIKISEFDKRFVYAYLQAPSVQGYFMDSLTGTTIKNLGLKAIREMIIFIPQDVDEQKRIGKFLYHLDNLITLHQRKCDELRKIKKFMLQNMFV